MDTSQREIQRIPWRRSDSVAWVYRFIGLLLCLLPLGLLVVAGRLEPSSSGLGTQQQLGLPPCTMLVILGVRCPSCGMTTSWAYFARGEFVESATANLGGFLLAIYSLAFAYFCILFAFQGRMPSYAAQKWLAVCLLAIVAVTLVGWGFRLLA